jgi:hypothetical protein
VKNPTWGYDRIQGVLANLGHKISDSTVANTLREHGIEPAPERKRKSLPQPSRPAQSVMALTKLA